MKKLILLPIILLLLSSLVMAQGGGSSSSNLSNNNADILLETLGMSLGQGIYTTYASIGTIADAYSKGTYESDFARQMLQEYVQLSRLMSEQLSKLLRSGKLSSSDKQYVNDIIQTYNYLKQEAQGYHDYINSENNTDLNAYNTNREKAWSNISRLLDL